MKLLKNKSIILCLTLLIALSFSTIIKAEDSVTLRIWTHAHPPMVKYIQEVLIPEFKKTHPDVNLEYSYYPTKDYNQKLLVGMATGTGPDFFGLGDWFFPQFYFKKLLDPVDVTAFGCKNQAQLEALYMKYGLSGLQFNGKLYGIPLQLNSLSLLINASYFREAGLDPQKDYPKTWAEMAIIAKKLVKYDKDGHMIRKGFDFPYNGPTWAMMTFDTLIQQFGGSVLSPDGKKATINSKAGIAAMTMWQDLAYKYKVGDPHNSVATANTINEDFTQGKVAMWTTGPWALAQIQANPEVYKNTIAVPYPQQNPNRPATLLYGFAWSVNTNAEPTKKKLAWDFIAMASERPTEWLLQLGFPQNRLNWYKSKEAQSFPFLDVWMKDISTGKFMTRSPYFDEISQSVDRAIQRCMYNKVSPKQSLDIAAKEINMAIAGQ